MVEYMATKRKVASSNLVEVWQSDKYSEINEVHVKQRMKKEWFQRKEKTRSLHRNYRYLDQYDNSQ